MSIFVADIFVLNEFDFQPCRSLTTGAATFRDISAGCPQFTKGADCMEVEKQKGETGEMIVVANL